MKKKEVNYNPFLFVDLELGEEIAEEEIIDIDNKLSITLKTIILLDRDGNQFTVSHASAAAAAYNDLHLHLVHLVNKICMVFKVIMTKTIAAIVTSCF